MEAPKYSVCFSDLADFLGLKHDVMDKVAHIEEEEEIESVASFR